MPAFCLTTESHKNLTEARKQGSISGAELLKAPTSERRKIFEKFTTKEEAKFINTEFEAALLSQQKKSITNWANKVFKTETTKLKDVQERIKDIDRVLNNKEQQELYEDFISRKLGVDVTAKEFAKVKEFADQLTVLKEIENENGTLIPIVDQFGNPTKEYFSKRRDLVNYLNSINPNSLLDVALGTIARGTLLFSIKSPFLNISSNTIFGLIGATQRRVQNRIGRGFNENVVWDYMKTATDLYNSTGYDTTTMTDVTQDFKVLGEKVTHAQGEGKVRRWGRFYEKWIFEKSLGVPDISTMAFHFADYLDTRSSRLAVAEGVEGKEARQKRSKEIMLDAMRVYPETDLGLTLRTEAQTEALFYTFKNRSVYSKVALDSRKLINAVGSQVGLNKLGEVLVPFAMTPANVLGAGIDYSGGFAFKGIREFIKAVRNKDIVTGKFNQENLNKAGYYFSQQALGVAFAMTIAESFDDDEFMTDYFSATDAERAFAKQNNIPFNSIKIGNRWVSFDYFSIFGAGIKALLQARKYGDDAIENTLNYTKAVGEQVLAIPGFVDVSNLFKDIKEGLAELPKKDKGKAISDAFGGLIDFTSSRLVPALISDVAIAIDPERKDKNKLFDSILAKIPGTGRFVDPFINVFGETIEREGFASQIFFGARVRTVRNDAVTEELERLMHTKTLPTIKELKRRTGKIRDIRDLKPDTFDRIVLTYGKNFKGALKKTFATFSYRKLSDEGKAEVINKIRAEELTKLTKGVVLPKKK